MNVMRNKLDDCSDLRRDFTCRRPGTVPRSARHAPQAKAAAAPCPSRSASIIIQAIAAPAAQHSASQSLAIPLRLPRQFEHARFAQPLKVGHDQTSRNSSSVIFSGSTGAFGSTASRIAWILACLNTAISFAHLRGFLHQIVNLIKRRIGTQRLQHLRFVVEMPHRLLQNGNRFQGKTVSTCCARSSAARFRASSR